ncbi:MAG: TonB C-terminal domain-containing protein [Lentisphaeria bacterium]|nr:TonB C-terminal domain-containing protein [Lentisphaeria bacterium]
MSAAAIFHGTFRGRAAIPATITLAHLAALLLLACSGLFRPPPPPPLRAIAVKLVSLPPPSTDDPEVLETKVPEPPKPDPPKPTPPKPDPPKPKPTKLPPPRPPAKKLVKRAPKKWTPVSPDDIRKNQPRKPRKKRQTVHIDPNTVARDLNKQFPPVRASPSKPRKSGAPAQPISRMAVRYYDAVGALLYELWQQPTRAEVGAGNPVVTVLLTVRSDGSLIHRRVLTKSGSSAMNGSVRAVLKNVESVPAPVEYGLAGASVPITVTFRLTD